MHKGAVLRENIFFLWKTFDFNVENTQLEIGSYQKWKCHFGKGEVGLLVVVTVKGTEIGI
jgi:hypothetical protein